MKVIFKTKDDNRWAQKKREEFEARTGLKWDTYRTGAGMGFTPIVTRDTILDETAADALLPYLTKRGGTGFVKLAEASGLELASVLIGANTLVRQGRAVPCVNRMGHFAGVYRR